MKYNYAFKSNKENVVKVVGRDLGISTKKAIEICSYIKGMPVKKAIMILEKVAKQEMAVPFKRFTEGAGHQKNIGAAKYPVKAAKQFLLLLKALEANAQNKGLSSELKIIHACTQKAAEPFHYGRKRRIKMKRTHVEIAAEEMEIKKEKAKEKETRKEKHERQEKEKLSNKTEKIEKTEQAIEPTKPAEEQK